MGARRNRNRPWAGHKLSVLLLIGLVFSRLAGASTAGDSEREEILAHVRYLASDELMGRAVGTPGIDSARDYIAGQFKKYGLIPGGESGSYFQRLTVTTGVRIKEPSNFAIGKKPPLKILEDWVPLGFSGSGSASGEVAFAGYGITAKDDGYDDYAGLDVKGKVVVILRYEPPPRNEKSPFRGPPRYSRYATFSSKIANARAHGAVGMILVDLSSTAQGVAELMPLTRSLGRGESSLVAVQMKRQAAVEWFRDRGLSLPELKQQIDREQRPASTLLSGSHVVVEVTLERIGAPTENVVGFLPGSDPQLAKESVVVGAHYDHLGLGHFGTQDRNQEGKIHNGADDNASGIAVLLSVARRFSERPERPKRSVVFVAFTGEELGLYGSRYYVNRPAFPLETTRAMINLDMVGRMRANRLTAFGLETNKEFRSWVVEAAQTLGVEIVPGGSRGAGRSDHAAFYDKNIPVLHLFTGAHEDYHRPSDDWEKLNIEGMAKVSGLVAAVGEKIAHSETPLTFVRLPPDQEGGASSQQGYGADLGTIPDLASSEPGVRLAGIREQGPAYAAGLKQGDVIVGLAEARVETVEDLDMALRNRKPGDQVEIVVLRQGKLLTLRAVLGTRGRS